ncbi:hypothetical protein M3P19_12055 [Muricauda sp. 2012CJ35-5]|uniref:Uncharacterized protein n=1 Tax=Flagellimonas spongiicola TaxID=2942208 RepID=A0ABT0PTM6_9FLAO|nr:hypothetical protein [Allomuricauda spongiicola]MCL6274745.1 hypothetical protein [Allomuricauda spongiicola]
MHLFTVTIYTGFFLEKHEDEILEKCAIGIFKEFKKIMDKEYTFEFNYDVYWRKGCVLTDIVVTSKDKELQDLFLQNKHDFKNNPEYLEFLKDLEKKLENLPPDLAIGSLMFNLKDFRLSRSDFELRGKRIDLKNLIINHNPRN